MAHMKQYGLDAIGTNVQIGKRGARLKCNVAGQTITFRDVSDSMNVRVKGAAPTEADDLTTKDFVDTTATTLDTRITTEKTALNSRIDTEVSTLNASITTQGNTINTRIDTEVATLNTSITAVDHKYDGQLQGLDTKRAVDLATKQQNISLIGSTPLLIDGITATTGMRVLLKDQTNAKENGIYDLAITNSLYTLTRSSDANNTANGQFNSEVRSGMFVFVQQGIDNGGSGWTLTAPKGNVVLGTDNISFTQFSYAGVVTPGVALSKDGVTLNVVYDDLFITVNASNQLTIKASTAGKIIATDSTGHTVWKTFDLADSAMVGSSILNIANGGTGLATVGTAGKVLTSNGSAMQWSLVDLSTSATVGTSILKVPNGGTGLSNISSGAIIHGAANNTYQELVAGAAGMVLTSDGSKPTYSKIDLSSSNTVGTSILNTANGGTGFNTFTQGDLLYGNGTSLAKLGVGTQDQYLVSNGTNPVWKTIYTEDLKKSTDGSVILNGVGVVNPANNLTVSNAQTGDSVVIGSEGDADVSITISPNGNGLLMAKTGYGFTTNSPALAFSTKGYVDQRVDAISTSRIESHDHSTFFDSALTGFTGAAVIGSNSKNLLEVVGSTTAATLGERVRITHSDNEIQFNAVNTTGVGNVNLRFIPQNSGRLLVGVSGEGLLEGEAGFGLLLRGGNGTTTLDGGAINIQGGDAQSNNTNGGDVVIRPGVSSGTGIPGHIYLNDDETNPVAAFKKGAQNSQNSFVFTSASTNADPAINAPKIQVTGPSADISLQYILKGNGLLRVANPTTYYNALVPSGNNDAFVTKQYVMNQVGGSTKYAGIGMTEDNSVFNVNIGATTVKVDASDNLVVASSNTAGQVMLSTGVAGQEAVWGNLDLSTATTFTGTLPTSKGGTGFNSYTLGDILAGDASGALVKISKGANNQVFGVNSSGALTYRYVSALRDANGLSSLQANGVANAVNYMTATNGILDGVVTLGSDGQNQDIHIVLSPKGNGLVIAKAGYTALITSSVSQETIVTKGYVDNLSQQTTPAGIRRVTIGGGASSVNIGASLPVISGRQVFVTRVRINITSAFTGNQVDGLRVVAGANVFMDIDENDVLAVGPYIADTNMAVDVNGQQVSAVFYKADGTTLTAPTGGAATVTIEYQIL